MFKRQLIMTEAGDIAQRLTPDNSTFGDFVTQGWAWYYRPHTRFTRQAARHSFERALEIQWHSADARIGLAVVLGQILLDGHSESAQQDEMLIEQLLLPVFEASTNNTMAHIAMGNLRFYQVPLAAARADFESALAMMSATNMRCVGWEQRFCSWDFPQRPFLTLKQPFGSILVIQTCGAVTGHWGNASCCWARLMKRLIFFERRRPPGRTLIF
jgi:hypothetical protein